MKRGQKKLLLIVAGFSLISLQCISAQDQSVPEHPRHYVQFNIGDPLFNMIYGGNFGCCGYCDYSTQYNWFTPDVYESAYTQLPTFSLSYYYAVKPWLHIGGELYYEGEYYIIRDRVTNNYGGVAGRTSLNILPTIRFQYFNRRIVGLYSGLSLGLHLNIESGNKLYDPTASNSYCTALPAFQLTAIGIRVGNRIFGTAEIGVGNKGIATIGIGARF
ncbi:MAG: hypothetical protein ACI3Z7_07475 [Candidatus Aphodosoma sp.]